MLVTDHPRERLIDGVRPVRSLLNALVRWPWQATDNHPVLPALRCLQGLYAHEQRHLPTGTRIFLGRVRQEVLENPDRERAFCAFEVATLPRIFSLTPRICRRPSCDSSPSLPLKINGLPRRPGGCRAHSAISREKSGTILDAHGSCSSRDRAAQRIRFVGLKKD
jgi:hypothetical protein